MSKIDLQTNIFSQFNDKWGLLCAGSAADHNAMTISWGGMGTLWGKSVVTVYVKPIRHTFTYLEKNGFFTVGFFPEQYRRALELMGTLSGRDVDKDREAGLTVRETEFGAVYEQAELTLACRKLYCQDLDPASIPADVMRAIYSTEAPHRMYIGEVVGILREQK